jgi:hypothetical protein
LSEKTFCMTEQIPQAYNQKARAPCDHAALKKRSPIGRKSDESQRSRYRGALLHWVPVAQEELNDHEETGNQEHTLNQCSPIGHGELQRCAR